jgi:hypothetical protein
MRLLSRSLAPQLGIDVDQHTVGDLSLARMTCDRVAMIEARNRQTLPALFPNEQTTLNASLR